MYASLTVVAHSLDVTFEVAGRYIASAKAGEVAGSLPVIMRRMMGCIARSWSPVGSGWERLVH
jgi:hypothetical protein